MNKPIVLSTGEWVLPVTHAPQKTYDWFARSTQVQGVLDLQLKIGQAFHVGPVQGFSRLHKQWAQGVVAPAGVAPAKHQGGRGFQWRTMRWISVPSASSKVTSSGILPRAWVAHDRQGS
mgnify:CR=1 FL=1